MFLKFLIALLPVCAAYHKTNTLLTRIKLTCALTEQLQCRMVDDILVVDWNAHETPDTLLVFNEHARERVTGELALKVIHKLKRWKPSKRVTIVPVLNVWGRKQVEKGHPCVRKNRRGVDTNRNFQGTPHHYGKASEEYEGDHPLSEKESQLVAQILDQGVQRYVNVHSGEASIYMPYDGSTDRPAHYDTMKRNIDNWGALCNDCVVGPAAKVSSYRAYGTSVDYAVHSGVPEAYTFEIFGQNSRSCERMFNPKPSELENVLAKWTSIFKEVV